MQYRITVDETIIRPSQSTLPAITQFNLFVMVHLALWRGMTSADPSLQNVVFKLKLTASYLQQAHCVHTPRKYNPSLDKPVVRATYLHHSLYTESIVLHRFLLSWKVPSLQRLHDVPICLVQFFATYVSCWIENVCQLTMLKKNLNKSILEKSKLKIILIHLIRFRDNYNLS